MCLPVSKYLTRTCRTVVSVHAWNTVDRRDLEQLNDADGWSGDETGVDALPLDVLEQFLSRSGPQYDLALTELTLSGADAPEAVLDGFLEKLGLLPTPRLP